MTKITNWGSDDPVEVAKGGTGVASTTAYAVMCGGTTATAPLQPIASVGTATQVLTSNGAGALPTFQDAGGGGDWVLIESVTASSDSTIEFDDLSTTYETYCVVINDLVPATNAVLFYAQMSYDNGTNWRTSGYLSSAIGLIGVSSGTGTGQIRHESITSGFIFNESDDNYALLSSTANRAANYVVFLHNPADSSFMTQLSAHGYLYSSNSNYANIICGGNYTTAEEQKAIKFYMSSGNISTGNFYLYGLTAS